MTFSHLDEGTPESAWAPRVAVLTELAPRAWGPDARLLVAVAHPDDETLGAAGLIRDALRGGARVHVLVATAGEASHPDSPTHTPADLIRIRRAEMDHALAALAAEIATDGDDAATGDAAPASTEPLPAPAERLTWESLELPDGGLAAHADALRARIERAIGEQGRTGRGAAEQAEARGVVVLASHDPEDGHGDHEAMGRAAARVAAEQDLPLYAFPIWFWHWGEPGALAARRYRRLPLRPGDAAARRAALDAHVSQVRPLSDAPGDEEILPARMIAHVDRDVEVHRYSGPEDGDSHRSTAVFDRLYREHDDPWHYLTSAYEARKRDLTLAALPRRRYGTAVEAGASIGVLTALLAQRAERVVGLEASELAVERAAARLADIPRAEVRHAVLPAGWPQDVEGAELLVASEIGYFLQPEEFDALVDSADASLGLGGELLLCHWRHPISGWPLDGDDVHARVAADSRWRVLNEHVEADFRITLHARAAAATHAVVVIPAREEEDTLPPSLAALGEALERWEAQHAQGSAAAVVAVGVDDAGTLAAARAARARDPRVHILELQDAPGGVGRARAEAARRARGLFADVPAERLWLASTDADTRVPADWLLAQTVLATRAAADGQALVLGTVDLASDAPEELVRTWRADYRHEEGHPHVHGANLGLSWALYERAGGFPAITEHEDVHLADAVRTLGRERILATDRTRVRTSHRLEGRTPGGFAGHLRDLTGEGPRDGVEAGRTASS